MAATPNPQIVRVDRILGITQRAVKAAVADHRATQAGAKVAPDNEGRKSPESSNK